MKNTFKIQDGAAEVSGSHEISDVLSDDVSTLGEWGKKIARRLSHEGDIKVIHQDQTGVVACRLNDSFSGEGQHIQQAAFSHSRLLAAL